MAVSPIHVGNPSLTSSKPKLDPIENNPTPLPIIIDDPSPISTNIDELSPFFPPGFDPRVASSNPTGLTITNTNHIQDNAIYPQLKTSQPQSLQNTPENPSVPQPPQAAPPQFSQEESTNLNPTHKRKVSRQEFADHTKRIRLEGHATEEGVVVPEVSLTLFKETQNGKSSSSNRCKLERQGETYMKFWELGWFCSSQSTFNQNTTIFPNHGIQSEAALAPQNPFGAQFVSQQALAQAFLPQCSISQVQCKQLLNFLKEVSSSGLGIGTQSAHQVATVMAPAPPIQPILPPTSASSFNSNSSNFSDASSTTDPSFVPPSNLPHIVESSLVPSQSDSINDSNQVSQSIPDVPADLFWILQILSLFQLYLFLLRLNLYMFLPFLTYLC
ncbi:hypothetical protein CMV_010216 [Castanea mollissima]|uniref:Uncharacterized protein n=1 Tax=Castanea mollissima TaxID=60419 RepID=A0A8J4VM47_9ROSI|nr:hypothetical protein CMV_010216 [Castanea mollissima]